MPTCSCKHIIDDRCRRCCRCSRPKPQNVHETHIKPNSSRHQHRKCSAPPRTSSIIVTRSTIMTVTHSHTTVPLWPSLLLLINVADTQIRQDVDDYIWHRVLPGEPGEWAKRIPEPNLTTHGHCLAVRVTAWLTEEGADTHAHTHARTARVRSGHMCERAGSGQLQAILYAANQAPHTRRIKFERKLHRETRWLWWIGGSPGLEMIVEKRLTHSTSTGKQFATTTYTDCYTL